MAAKMTLEKGAKAKAEGTTQDLNFAADVGAYKYVAARLRLTGIAGAPSGGTVTIQIQTATENKEEEYIAVPGTSGADLEYTINFNDPTGDIQLEISERFARYLRWAVTDWSFTGGSGEEIGFSIDLVLKD